MIILATTLGCDDRATRIAREAADRQAEQNRTMAELEHEVAAGARQLVAEEGQARRQTLEIHRSLQAERGQLADAWSDLESERQKIARARRSESYWAAVLPAGGGALAAALAIAFSWIVLAGLRGEDGSAAVACQLLLEEIGDGLDDQTESPPSRPAALPRFRTTRLLDAAPLKPPFPQEDP